jgi:hypothetical protein
LRELFWVGREEVPWETVACVLTIARFCAQPRELGITNLSDQWIASKPPYPVLLSYHVRDADDALVVYDGRRTRLECPIPPAGVLTQTMLVDAPTVLQRYTLHLSIVQEGRFWFDGFPGDLPRKIPLLVSV